MPRKKRSYIELERRNPLRKQLRVGVIGIGAMGKNHARLYSELGGVAPVGLANTDDKSTRSLAERSQARPVSDCKEFPSNDLDAVSIAVPTPFHREVVHFGPAEWLPCHVCAHPAKT